MILDSLNRSLLELVYMLILNSIFWTSLRYESGSFNLTEHQIVRSLLRVEQMLSLVWGPWMLSLRLWLGLRLHSNMQNQWNSFGRCCIIATFHNFWRLLYHCVYRRRSWPNGCDPSSEKFSITAVRWRFRKTRFAVHHWWVELAWLKLNGVSSNNKRILVAM